MFVRLLLFAAALLIVLLAKCHGQTPGESSDDQNGAEQSVEGVHPSLFERTKAAERKVKDEQQNKEETELVQKKAAAVPLANIVQFKSDAGQEDDDEQKPPPFGYDYLKKGDDLTAEEADKRLVFTTEDKKSHQINGWVPEHAVLQLRYKSDGPSSPEQCSASKPNPLSFTARICLEPGKECPKGITACYVGQLDSEEYEKWLQLNNEPGNEIVGFCQKNAGPFFANAKKPLHGLLVRTEKTMVTDTGNGQQTEKIALVIESSFIAQSDKLEMVGDCMEYQVGTDTRIYGAFSTEDEEQVREDFENKVMNGVDLPDMAVRQVFPLDLLASFDTKATEHLSFHGSQDCRMTIKLFGDNLQICREHTCQRPYPPPAQPKLEDKKKLYAKEFEELLPISDVYMPNEIPDELKGRLYFELDSEDNPRAVFATKGEEFAFAVATAEDKPPVFQILRPPSQKFCTHRGKEGCIKNEIVLGYNARPDCFVRFCWGERKLYFRDEMSNFGEVLSIRDKNITVEGENFDEFGTIDQFGSPTTLGRGTCSMDSQQMPQKVQGLEQRPFVWRFILNPQKGAKTPKAQMPECPMLAIGFNLRESTILLPKDLGNLLKNKKAP